MMARILFLVLLMGYAFSDRLGAAFGSLGDDLAANRQSFVSAASACDIKGNVSLNTGERIYHMPGQEHYSETIITRSKGERWFCSEDEARAAGWRKARR